jgi:hypothetical protein
LVSLLEQSPFLTIGLPHPLNMCTEHPVLQINFECDLHEHRAMYVRSVLRPLKYLTHLFGDHGQSPALVRGT